MKNIMPTLPELGREALIVLGGAVIAAAILYTVPSVKTWIKKAWE